MKFASLLLLLAALSMAQAQTSANASLQRSTGNCSPNIVTNGSGPVTVQISGSCGSVDPRVLTALEKTLQQFLAQFPKTIGNLNELLDKKNGELADKAKEVEDWIRKFNELSQRLEQHPPDYESSKQAADALHRGDLKRAEDLLNELLAKEEKLIDLTAQNQFNLAQLLELRFEPLQALPHYQKAYGYRPDSLEYGQAYAHLLYEEKMFSEAGPVFNCLLKVERERAKLNPQTFLPYVAAALNDLGLLYRDTERLEEAVEAYKEALGIERELAKVNPPAYLPLVATTLNNLGFLYTDTQRQKKAEDALSEALQIRRELAKTDPQEYLSYVATTLNNLGILYRKTQRLKDATNAYNEALWTFRELEKSNPATHLPDIAMVLNNLGNLYRETRRPHEAATAYAEALNAYHELAIANPPAYLPDVAMTLNNIGILEGSTQQPHKATVAITQSIQIYRDLAKANPSAYLPSVAEGLNNLGNSFSQMERYSDALGTC